MGEGNPIPSHFMFIVRVGAGVVLGGVGTLASPWVPELHAACRRVTLPPRATQASPIGIKLRIEELIFRRGTFESLRE